jgi:hypothetical protein
MSNETKQTAVEWLVQELTKNKFIAKNGDFTNPLIEQAKKMEQQQIMEAYSNGAEDEYNYQMDIQGRREDMDSETYFNNTYGKQQNG